MKGIRHLNKPLTLLYCDTGVEIPVIAEHVRKTLARIKRQAKQDGIPIQAKIVKPRLEDSFFVKVIGRGYPPPTNRFRWCTDRLRIGPVRRVMQSSAKGHSLMLLGTRWKESLERTRTLARFRLKGTCFFKQVEMLTLRSSLRWRTSRQNRFGSFFIATASLHACVYQISCISTGLQQEAHAPANVQIVQGAPVADLDAGPVRLFEKIMP